jgi:ribosome biogenesis GTPase
VHVRDDKGDQHQCLVRGRRLSPLPGDAVTCDQTADGSWFIATVEPRQSVLTRIDKRGRPESIASNISQLLVVVAPTPQPDWFLVDRFLVAAELTGIEAIVIWNKSDLMPPADMPAIGTYPAVGYRLVASCAQGSAGSSELAAVLNGQRSVLVGQSGVGKSSLMNSLLGTALQTTGTLSDRNNHGRHTTTTAVMHELPGGGELIDSPGVRNYAPYIEVASRLEGGFREFAPYLGRCRFDDCQHDREPDCAITDAVANGDIAASRYRSYLQLRETLLASGA